MDKNETAIRKIYDFINSCESDLIKLFPLEEDESRDKSFDELESLVLTLVYNKAYGLVAQPKKDKIMMKKLQLYNFITLENLENNKKNINQDNLSIIKSQIAKIFSYKSAKDKLVCIVNACKLVSGMVKHAQSGDKETGADDFLPCLIYSVLKANPKNPISDLNFIKLSKKNLQA